MNDELNYSQNLIIEGTTLVSVKDKNVTNIVIPPFVTEIKDSALSGCKITSISIPSSVTKIGHAAFRWCLYLTDIVIPDSVTSIEEDAFSNCPKLENVVIPNSIKAIKAGTFQNCTSLSNFVIPESVETIENFAFDNCSSLTNLIIPNSVTRIDEGAFKDCANITNLVIPDSVTRLGDYAFTSCESLENLTIPNSLTFLTEGVFSNCYALKSVSIPSSVTHIHTNAFRGCKSLADVVIPNSVVTIGNDAFTGCRSLTNIVIPSSVIAIGDAVFTDCTNLTTIVLPESINSISSAAFFGCTSLTDIVIPSSILSIKSGAFWGCKSLKEIVIPNSVKRIEDYAFKNCSSLTNVVIPDSVTQLGDSIFDFCPSLTSVVIPSSVTQFGSAIFDHCPSLSKIRLYPSNSYLSVKTFPSKFMDNIIITKTNKGLVVDMSVDPLEPIGKNQIHVKNPYLLSYYIRFFDDKNKLKALDKIDPKLTEYLDYKNTEILKDNQNPETKIDYNAVFNYNMKSFNNLLKTLYFNNIYLYDDYRDYDFFKFCENLGVFNSEPIAIRSTSKSGKDRIQLVDYAQKAREFLKDRINEGYLPQEIFYIHFREMKPLGFKRGFADFFLNKNNFEELMIEEGNHPGFTARCYNDFEIVQAAHTSQRGSQRQLAPTVEFFKQYFMENKFAGVTEETKDIAETISPYFSRQQDFDNAVEIYRERQEKGTPDNILEEEEIREEGVFEKVDSLLKETKNVAIDTTATLVDLANRKFTYEFLRKSDPQNFILGKLCSCCAHLEGEGNGIMRASIVHPDVQNIVIRNKANIIIAKSTLYINREQRYGVCNNVEISSNVAEEDKKLIYLKFKKAIEVFAKKYNAKYTDQPLRIITVGMNLNDLGQIIEANDIPSVELYKALDYGKYSYTGSGYSGDSSESQYIVWENSNLTEGQTL